MGSNMMTIEGNHWVWEIASTACPITPGAGRRLVLLKDPSIGACHAVGEGDVGLPAELLLDQRVVTVATVDSLGC